MLKDFQDQFPALNNQIYLNTASCGLLSKELVEWRREHDEKLLNAGSNFRDLHKIHISSIREDVASFFSTKSRNIALVPNFSFGMNILLDGLPSRKKVLIIDGDYPSLIWPVETRDYDIRKISMTVDLENSIRRVVKEFQPDIFVLSIVQYISGIKIDLNFLQELKHQYPKLLIIGDGTQYLGTEEFNFEESGFDAVGASAYKWMLAGYGVGFFLIQDDLLEQLSTKTIGFNSADATFSKRNQIEKVGHFEPGHQDTLNYGSLKKSIEIMRSVGVKSIHERIFKLSSKAYEEFAELSLLDDIVVRRKPFSTIFNLKGDDFLFQKLKERNIVASRRGNGIRVSFHFYNSDEELDMLLDCLKNNRSITQ